MALRNVIKDTDPLLRKRSRDITEITDRIRTLADDMWETMYESNGVGLAAPQVGVLRRLVVIDVTVNEEDIDEEDAAEPEAEPKAEPEIVKYLLINPEVVEASEETVTDKEGCLSVPGRVGTVVRPARVKVRAMDLDGNLFEIEGEGLLAKALQHEIDHLEGILYTDIAESVEPVEPAEPQDEGDPQ